MILGNEFFDALPVHLVDVRGPRPLEAWVAIRRGAGGEARQGLREVWDDISGEVEAELRFLFGTLDTEALRPFSRDGFIEVRPALRSLRRESPPSCRSASAHHRLRRMVSRAGSLRGTSLGSRPRWRQGPERRPGRGVVSGRCFPSGPDGGRPAPRWCRLAEGASCRCDYAGEDVVQTHHPRVLQASTGRRPLHSGRPPGPDGRCGFQGPGPSRARDRVRDGALHDRGGSAPSRRRPGPTVGTCWSSARAPSQEALEAGQGGARCSRTFLTLERLGGAFKAMLQVRE